MKNQDIYQSEEGLVGPGRELIVHSAISYALGHSDWQLVEVADRGRYLEWEDGTEVFLFDSKPLVKFRKLMTEELSPSLGTRTHYQYCVLYEVK